MSSPSHPLPSRAGMRPSLAATPRFPARRARRRRTARLPQSDGRLPAPRFVLPVAAHHRRPAWPALPRARGRDTQVSPNAYGKLTETASVPPPLRARTRNPEAPVS
jgi:hypothetical protein